MPTTTLHSDTPEISVLDNRKAAIRTLRYQRKDIAEEVNERIEWHTFSSLGHLTSTTDARFFTNNTACNFQYHYALNGKALRTDSVDAGSSYVFYDIEGKPLWQQDARATQQHYDYDLLGRHTERRETLAGETSAVRERFCYGDSGEINDDGRKNLRGQLAKHYDTAGLLDYSVMGYGLESSPLQQQRQLLPIETDSDWQGSDANGWQQALTGDTYTTGWRYAADGQVLQQTDTKGHQQRSSYDVMGRLKASSVTLNGDSEQSVLTAVSYNAAGRKLREQAANHIVTDYSYEPETQRLLGMTTTRGNTRLQQWHYSYDPVGNITALANAAEVDSYFNNQQATAVRHYQYDTLYQLISASGRENPGQSSVIDNPAAIVPPPDSGQYVPYTRNYQYDAGGNLTQIQHQADNHHYTRTLRVSAHSNHAILDTSTVTRTVGHIEEAFDACGNQQQLDTGQRLLWDGLNQLQRVTTIARDSSEDDDRESYSYGADGMRVRKTGTTQASGGNTLQQQDVIYLPGIELRRTHSNQVVTEHLEVITIGAAGRSQVRLLHWLDGTEPDAIANRQWRYSLDDHLGSSHLELDDSGNILTKEEYYAYGGTAVRTAKSTREVKYKTIRYSGKERDSSGLYYYGYRYYQPWLGRWLNTDPAGTVDGLNLYRMVRNNPLTLSDGDGTSPSKDDVKGMTREIKHISRSAKVVRENLNKSDQRIVATAGLNIAISSLAGPINYAAGMLVPPIAVAPAMLAGLSGTVTGDLTNRALNKVADKAVGTDLSHTLETSKKPKGKPVLGRYSAPVADYGFAIATGNSFPYAVTDASSASRSGNYVTKNLTKASKLIYDRQTLAKQAYHDAHTAADRIKMLADTVNTIDESSPALAIIKMRMGVKKAESRLNALKEDAYRIGYPAGYASKHFGPGHIGIAAHFEVNRNVKFDYIDN
ncbi:hypothetical protein AB835_02550 [Candidatus Endobugula sertula]|uniref:Uncharacterized protein n=1 Tax=Candidatus Endobugula sertula TaxID=62101 RepID=A0A1D2QSQ7_9GAMM|nr:hypothetical protein AB835_02550 [Candidatus Endobugula sertula]